MVAHDSQKVELLLAEKSQSCFRSDLAVQLFQNINHEFPKRFVFLQVENHFIQHIHEKLGHGQRRQTGFDVPERIFTLRRRDYGNGTAIDELEINQIKIIQMHGLHGTALQNAFSHGCELAEFLRIASNELVVFIGWLLFYNYCFSSHDVISYSCEFGGQSWGP